MSQKNPPEAEIIRQPEGYQYKEQYRVYAKETKRISVFAWVTSVLSLVFSLIPIFGFIFALFALVVAGIKKTPLFLPIFALILASISTSFLLIISWLVSLIF